MKNFILFLFLLPLLWNCNSFQKSHSSGVEKLYVLYCGEGDAPDTARWTPGVVANHNKPLTLSNSCYLIKHEKGWMLWETGFSEAIVGKPNGYPTPVLHWYWREKKSLTQQLADLGVNPNDIAYVGFSHAHADHIGNAGLFNRAQLLIQDAEYDFYLGPKATTLAGLVNYEKIRQSPTTQLHGDKDIFGDESLTILSSSGHTPGHQSLLVKLPKTGYVLLTGDAAHFRENWDNPRAPVQNFSKEATLISIENLKKIASENNAKVWINHDVSQTTTLKKFPEYYD